jgi:hypothetical protein
MSHRRLIRPDLRGRRRPEAVRYLYLGSSVVRTLSRGDRLHEQLHEPPAGPERFRRVALYLLDALPQRP